MFVLYGRRRIGKTALVTEALKAHPRGAYHVGTRSTITEELGRLSATLGATWEMPLLGAQRLSSTAALLALLEGTSGPAVLVLDEFPFLVESDPTLPGLLQASWDRRLSHGDLKLVFCGSSVGMMEETFLGRHAPLFGRRTGQLRLGPLPLSVLHEVFPWHPAEVVELYALFGGVPGYLQRLDPSRDLVSNLVARVLTRGEPLYEEVPFLLREELREPRVYHAILATVAAGARRFGEISSKVGLDRANLMRYLATLIDLGLVEREVPVTEKQPDKSRKGLYRIADPFVRTWFTFVHPHRDLIERGAIDEGFRRVLRQRLAQHLSLAVEPALRGLFADGPWADLVPFAAAHAGRHWTDQAELDLVLLDRDREKAFIGEVKWSSRPVGRELLDDLRARVAREPKLAACECTYALLSRGGFVGRRPIARDERLIDVSKLRWSQLPR
jgi:hypothetical protein